MNNNENEIIEKWIEGRRDIILCRMNLEMPDEQYTHGESCYGENRILKR